MFLTVFLTQAARKLPRVVLDLPDLDLWELKTMFTFTAVLDWSTQTRLWGISPARGKPMGHFAQPEAAPPALTGAPKTDRTRHIRLLQATNFFPLLPSKTWEATGSLLLFPPSFFFASLCWARSQAVCSPWWASRGEKKLIEVVTQLRVHLRMQAASYFQSFF